MRRIQLPRGLYLERWGALALVRSRDGAVLRRISDPLHLIVA